MFSVQQDALLAVGTQTFSQEVLLLLPDSCGSLSPPSGGPAPPAPPAAGAPPPAASSAPPPPSCSGRSSPRRSPDTAGRSSGPGCRAGAGRCPEPAHRTGEPARKDLEGQDPLTPPPCVPAVCWGRGECVWGGLGSNVKLFKSAAYEVLPEPEPAFRFVWV